MSAVGTPGAAGSAGAVGTAGTGAGSPAAGPGAGAPGAAGPRGAVAAGPVQGTAVSVQDVVVTYGRGRTGELRAVDGVSFEIPPGGSLGVIGESGSGKSSLALALAGLVRPSSGRIGLDGGGAKPQMIFQDPLLALNPRRRVWQSVAEPLQPRSFRVSAELRPQAVALLERVGLGGGFADRAPRQLSGGQRQRVTIARALAAHTGLILCDEPVAALDVSLQAGILRLLADLRDEQGLTYLLISHELKSVRLLTDRVAVLYMGRFVEVGPTAEVLGAPRHPYSRALVRSAPEIGKRAPAQPPVRGEVPDPRNPPSGCRFHTRCPYATDLCAAEVPALVADGPGGRAVACHHWERIAADTTTSPTPSPTPSGRTLR